MQGLLDVILGVVLLLSIIQGCESQSEEEYLSECIVDKTLPPGEEGNYLDCSLEETAKDGKTDCCQLDGQTGCCKKGEKWDKIIVLCTIIGCIAVGLAIILFVVFWLNPSTFPCITSARKSVAKKYRKYEEEYCVCCSERISKRKRQDIIKQEEQQRPQYDVPDDINRTVQEDFWA